MCKIPTPRSIEAELHKYPKRHGLSIDWIAIELWNEYGIKVADKTLARYLNPNDELSFPLEIMIPFCLLCNQDCTAIDHLNESAGRVAVEIPQRDEDVDLKSLAKLAETSGAAMSSMAESLADGIIDNQERKDLTKSMVALAQRVNIIIGKLNK